MCRQNQLWGCALMALGFGILIGMMLKSGLLSLLLGVGLVTLGFYMFKRK